MRHGTLFATAAFCVSFVVNTAADAQGQKFTDTLCGVSVTGEIKAPPAGANPALARYLGVWAGSNWKSGVCNGLVVSEVTNAGVATVKYIFPPTRDVPQGWFEKSDAVLDPTGRLTFKSLLGADVIFQIQPDGTLSGWFTPKDSGGSTSLVGHKRKVAAP
jgi:hypothetical protein